MLFSYTVRAVYVESCSMFVRGGVYRAVKQSLGGALAKFSVSALMFDYISLRPHPRVSAASIWRIAGAKFCLNAHITAGPLFPASIDIIATCFESSSTFISGGKTPRHPNRAKKALPIS